MAYTVTSTAADERRREKMHLSREWSGILLQMCPTGRLPAPGSPRRIVIDHVADTLASNIAFEPIFETLDVLGDGAREEILNIATQQVEPYEHDGRRIGEAPDSVKEILASRGIIEMARSRIPLPIVDDFSVAFLYYSAGEYLRLHVDNSYAFEFNLLGCLRRVRPSEGRKSATYFLTGAQSLKAYDMSEGQGILFHSGMTPHGRTPLADGEEAVLVTVGFRQD